MSWLCSRAQPGSPSCSSWGQVHCKCATSIWTLGEVPGAMMRMLMLMKRKGSRDGNPILLGPHLGLLEDSLAHLTQFPSHLCPSPLSPLPDFLGGNQAHVPYRKDSSMIMIATTLGTTPQSMLPTWTSQAEEHTSSQPNPALLWGPKQVWSQQSQ